MFTFSLICCLIDLALWANFIEDKVSDRLNPEGLSVIIIWVCEFPPRPSFKICVNFESLYGIWDIY
jgi:hypothetical protein